MIKVIIFDLGGVCLTQSPELWKEVLLELFGDKTDNVMGTWNRFYGDLLIGRATIKDFLKEASKSIEGPESADSLLSRMSRLYEAKTKSNERLLEYIRKLRTRYKVALLTDTFEEFDFINEERGVFKNFDMVLKSFSETESKFDGNNLFRVALKKLGVTPEECVFIDDTETYTDAFKSLGGYAIVYKGNADLFKKLESFGIFVDSNTTIS